jgi:hypothetical protein
MADEFAKGLAILSVAGLAWMTLAGWYQTPGFEETQLFGEMHLENPTVYDQIGLVLMDAMFWFAIVGALTFWVVIPAVDEARTALRERNES